MSNKTIKVNELVDIANKMLSWEEKAPYITKDFKEGVCSFLEKVLQETKSYNGYMFLSNENCEINTFGYASRKYLKKQ